MPGLHIPTASNQEAVDMMEGIRVELSRQGSLIALERQEFERQLRGKEDLILESYHLNKGREDFTEGRVLYERAEFGAAIPVLERSVQVLEQGLRHTPEIRDLHESLLLLGICHSANGNEPKARQVLSRLVELDPNRELDPIHYPPHTLSLYKDVWETVHRQAFGRLDIQLSAGQQGEVWVDGISRGPAPLVVRDIPPGLHHVLVTSSEGHGGYQAMTVAEGRTQAATIDIHLLRIEEDESDRKERSEQIRKLYQVLGTHSDAHLILLAGLIDKDSVAVQLYEPRTGNFSKILRADAEGDPVAAINMLLPAMNGYLTSQGNIAADRVSFKVISLHISANEYLANQLLNPSPTSLALPTLEEQRMPRWILWAGIGTVTAVAIPTTIRLSTQEPPTGSTGDNGEIIVGPLP